MLILLQRRLDMRESDWLFDQIIDVSLGCVKGAEGANQLN